MNALSAFDRWRGLTFTPVLFLSFPCQRVITKATEWIGALASWRRRGQELLRCPHPGDQAAFVLSRQRVIWGRGDAGA